MQTALTSPTMEGVQTTVPTTTADGVGESPDVMYLNYHRRPVRVHQRSAFKQLYPQVPTATADGTDESHNGCFFLLLCPQQLQTTLTGPTTEGVQITAPVTTADGIGEAPDEKYLNYCMRHVRVQQRNAFK